MKKLLTIAALMGVASLGFGQGSVNFSAGASASTRLSTNGPSGSGQISGAGNYYFALFVAPTTTGTNYSLGASLDPTANGFTFFGAYGTNTASVGRMTGNPTTDDVIVPGYGAGSSADFVVVGWSAGIAGSDWAAFRTWYNNGSPQGAAGFAGHSYVAEGVQLGGGLIPPGTIFGAGVGQVPGFTLQYINVPEPSTFALAGIGAAALVIFRRRKA